MVIVFAFIRAPAIAFLRKLFPTLVEERLQLSHILTHFVEDFSVFFEFGFRFYPQRPFLQYFPVQASNLLLR